MHVISYPPGLPSRGNGIVMDAPHSKFDSKKESAFKSYHTV
jgi:hypothetical protein